MLLLIDADDTLWENNIYFERVIEQFIAHLNHRHLAPAEVREVINEIERANAAAHGYGTASFTRNLRQVYEHLAHEPCNDWEWLAALARTITGHPIEILEGVAETIEYLYARHRVILFTKGDREEQTGKIARSGLGDFFHGVRIVKEKNAAAYELAAMEFGAAKQETWMVGNSPRSDINPALAAGLNAVWIPHHATWILEHEDVTPAPGRLLTLESFRDLQRYF